jgi:hypothetical protein
MHTFIPSVASYYTTKCISSINFTCLMHDFLCVLARISILYLHTSKNYSTSETFSHTHPWRIMSNQKGSSLCQVSQLMTDTHVNHLMRPSKEASNSTCAGVLRVLYHHCQSNIPYRPRPPQTTITLPGNHPCKKLAYQQNTLPKLLKQENPQEHDEPQRTSLHQHEANITYHVTGVVIHKNFHV